MLRLVVVEEREVFGAETTDGVTAQIAHDDRYEHKVDTHAQDGAGIWSKFEAALTGAPGVGDCPRNKQTKSNDAAAMPQSKSDPRISRSRRTAPFGQIVNVTDEE